MLTISSGGCNALNYLIENPESVMAVDLNSYHIYLLQLKLAALQFLPTYEDFFAFFGFGKHKRNVANYKKYIAPNIERNSIYGDANYKVDLRLSRTFRVKEKVSVEIIAEGFNIFNRANFNGFNTTVYNVVNNGTQDASVPLQFTTNPTFGLPDNDGSQPDGTNARRFQVAARFVFRTSFVGLTRRKAQG